MTPTISHLRSVRHLRIVSYRPMSAYPRDIETFIRSCVVTFPHVRRLELITASRFPGAKDLIHSVNAATGVRALVIEESGNKPQCYVWVAEKRQPFLWSDHEYSRSVPWRNIGLIYQFLTGYHRHAFWRTYGTMFPGLMCRHIVRGCEDNQRCPCALLPPPRYICQHPPDSMLGRCNCGIAPNGLDSFGSYTL